MTRKASESRVRYGDDTRWKRVRYFEKGSTITRAAVGRTST